MPDDLPTTNSHLTRRGVMTTVAVGASALGVSSCGSDDSDGGSGASSDGGGAGGGGGATVAKSDVPVGGGVVDKEAKIVVTQPTEGDFKAFSAVCTHEGCSVDQVQDKTITCPCHNSQFDASTGEVKDGPAKKPLPAKKVKADGDNLTIT